MSTLPSTAHGEADALTPSRRRAQHPWAAAVLRLRVAVGADALDTALAHGARRSERPELALRAEQLERRRHRRALGRTIRSIVAEACGPRPPARATAVIISRPQIRAHDNELLALADRLESANPACAPGVAIAQRLVTDALASPLYVESGPNTLGHLARQAIAGMESPAERLPG